MSEPGNADVPVGRDIKRADEDVGDPRGNGEVGAYKGLLHAWLSAAL